MQALPKGFDPWVEHRIDRICGRAEIAWGAGANESTREINQRVRCFPARMIFGINATRSAVVIVEARDKGSRFAITAIRPIPFQVGSGEDLAELLRRLITLFDRGIRHGRPTIALLKCSSGRFGSCLEAIKGEAIMELAAFQKGLRVIKVAPQSLKKALGCAADQKWRDRTAELFNPNGKHSNWSKGAAAAIAAAFKVAGEPKRV